MAARKCARPECRNEPRSSRAKFCDDVDCGRARNRRRRQESRAAATAVESESVDGRPVGGVFASTLAELTEALRVQTPAGQQALAMAAKLDAGLLESGSSYAALGKQHLAALDQALRGADSQGDAGDELGDRRRRRLAGG